MIKNGVSVFLGLKEYSLEENIKYLEYAKSLGYEMVFSSIHISEADTILEDFQKMFDKINSLGMKLSLDISKKVYDAIKLPECIYALRLDYGFTIEDTVEMSKNAPYLIELNASGIDEYKLKAMIEKGLNVKNVRACFNYYPRLHTGHSMRFTEERIKLFHKYGMEIAGFVPSHVNFRPPMYEGLPTVESHRNGDLSVAIEELKLAGIDEIFFGDAYASKDELETLARHRTDEVLINVECYNDYIDLKLLNPFNVRVDSNDEILRFGKRSQEYVIAPFNTVERKKFDVTVDNELFLRYMGEANIVLTPLEKDERVNVIGRIIATDYMIDKIDYRKTLRLVKR